MLLQEYLLVVGISCSEIPGLYEGHPAPVKLWSGNVAFVTPYSSNLGGKITLPIENKLTNGVLHVLTDGISCSEMALELYEGQLLPFKLC